MMSQSHVTSEIDRHLEMALAPDSPNRISVTQLHEWVIEYLDDHAKELIRFPELVGQPHWNLWMIDVHPENALFAALVFRSDELEFCCGTGDAFDIKRFAEDDFPNNTDDFLPAAVRRFRIPDGIVHFEKKAAHAWLGRGW